MGLIRKGILFVKNLALSPFYRSPKVLSCEKTLEYIIEHKINIGRFGDGELDIMMGGRIGFQEFNADLAEKMKCIKNEHNFLTCIPNIFNKKYFNRKLIVKNEYWFWKKNKFKYKYAWGKFFNKNEFCGDAFISRFYIRLKDKSHVEDYINKLKKLWDKKNLIIVEGQTSQIGVGNDILGNAKSIRRIICPSMDAYSCYDKIINAIKNHYNQGDLVLIALGPTATILAYDLSKENIWALDMGHFDIEYEWFLIKAACKVPIRNKHVNECNSMGDNSKEKLDKQYLKQIICTIE